MRTLKSIIIVLALIAVTVVQAQTITSVHGTVSDEMGPLTGATVCEIDGNGRIIESAVTDLNGNFTMKVKNPKDKLRFSFVGLKTQTLPINKTTYKVNLESATTRPSRPNAACWATDCPYRSARYRVPHRPSR